MPYKNKKKKQASYKKWYYKNHERVLELKKEEYKRNRKKYLNRIRAVKLECINHYSKGSNDCQCCGESKIEFLSIDHIDGGGSKEKKEIGYGSLTQYLKTNDFPVGYRVLCFNCNLSLGFFGYCPHNSTVKNK